MKIFLNLLPPEKKLELRRRFYAKLFLWQWFTVFLMSLVFVTVVAGAYFVITWQQKSSELDAAVPNTGGQEKLAQYEASFAEANESAKTVLHYEALHPSFTAMLEKINSLLPEKITLKKLSTKDYHVYMTGEAATRSDFLTLQENLKNERCFQSINAPISNLFAEQNVSFEIDFLVLPECLQGNGF